MIYAVEDKPYKKVAMRHHKMDGIVVQSSNNLMKVVKGYKEFIYKKTADKSWKNQRETIRKSFDIEETPIDTQSYLEEIEFEKDYHEEDYYETYRSMEEI